MKKIIEDNYRTIVDRGLIKPSTTHNDFINKIYEEADELSLSYDYNDFENTKEELADVILTCLNMAKHFDIDIEQEIKNKIKINRYRAKNEKKT
tara:strand:- start:1798 stop:2079 length:282 start_codon:yes stop_codon:yes gene_type:complete